MISVDEQVALLDGTRWANGFSWAQLRSLLDHMELQPFEAGQVLVKEGSREGGLAVLVDGEVEVRKKDGAGVQQAVARLRRGSTFGEMSLLDGEPRSATVAAVTDGLLLTLTEEELDALVRETPRLAVEVYRRLGRMASQNLRRTSGQLVDALSPGGQ